MLSRESWNQMQQHTRLMRENAFTTFMAQPHNKAETNLAAVRV